MRTAIGVALIAGSLFFNLPKTSADAFSRGGALFISSVRFFVVGIDMFDTVVFPKVALQLLQCFRPIADYDDGSTDPSEASWL